MWITSDPSRASNEAHFEGRMPNEFLGLVYNKIYLLNDGVYMKKSVFI